MIQLIIAVSVLMVSATFVFMGIYDVIRQVKKQKYDNRGNYISPADEPYEGHQITSVPEKQIQDENK
jgi:hypothetical protein